MYSLKEIATGYWLEVNENHFGPAKFSHNLESDNTLEKETEVELEGFMESFNASEPGRTGIFSSPRPH